MSTEVADLTVKPCVKCGARDRDKSGKCKPCKRETNRKWAAENPDKNRESKRKYYEANCDDIAKSQRLYREANVNKVRNSNRKYRESNPDKERERGRKWREENPHKARERDRKYRKSNPTGVREKQRKYRKANPDKIKVRNHNRRASIEGNGGKLSKDIVQRLLVQQNGNCACCGADLSQTGYHLDHIMPLALGGLNSDENVQLLTPKCNLRKGAKHPDEWRAINS
jgi:5-methylcytosine-specific restriction endonuclease McrA